MRGGLRIEYCGSTIKKGSIRNSRVSDGDWQEEGAPESFVSWRAGISAYPKGIREASVLRGSQPLSVLSLFLFTMVIRSKTQFTQPSNRLPKRS
jgi:hypothetical protein